MHPTRTVSRAAIAAAISLSGRTAQTGMDLDRDGRNCLSIELDSEATLFPIIAAIAQTTSPETALDLANRIDFDHVGYRVIARFPGCLQLEPSRGPGSVSPSVGGWYAINRAGFAAEIEDEATAWEYAASGGE